MIAIGPTWANIWFLILHLSFVHLIWKICPSIISDLKSSCKWSNMFRTTGAVKSSKIRVWLYSRSFTFCHFRSHLTLNLFRKISNAFPSVFCLFLCHLPIKQHHSSPFFQSLYKFKIWLFAILTAILASSFLL